MYDVTNLPYIYLLFSLIAVISIIGDSESNLQLPLYSDLPDQSSGANTPRTGN